MNKRFIIGLFVLLIFLIAYKSGFLGAITLENLKYYAHQLKWYVAHHYWKVVFVYWLIYTISMIFSLPCAAIFTMAGGYMFGMIAVLYVTTALTLGSLGAFLIARYVLGDFLQERYGKHLATFNKAMKHDGGWYLFTIRLIPVIPFFMVNSLVALTRISVRDFVISTFFGMIFPTVIFTFAGTELASVQEVNDVFSTKVLLALAFMVLFSLLPLLYKFLKERR